MSYINRGGAVFPQPQNYGEWADGSPWFEGLSLRDYFAAKAMQSIIMSVDDKDDMSAPITESAYKWADAMLKAREQ
jgi:hypothetical protein